MSTTPLYPLPLADEAVAFGPTEYARAVLNILDDYGTERGQFLDNQRAVLNILEDFSVEQLRLMQTQSAVLNILEDLAGEKEQLEAAQKEVLRSEDALRQSLCEKEVLLKEIHHRVKNNLQIISSLLLLQTRHVSDPEARAILCESQNRVRSIALVHEKLHQSADLAHIDLGEYIEALVGNLFQTYAAGSRGISREVDVSVRMTTDVAIPCGLIVNELVTNSLKHAFPRGRTGTVRINAQESDAFIEIVVQDDGIGLPIHIEPKSGKSLGLDLVFTLARQIKADVQVVRDPGTIFRLRFGPTGGNGRGRG